MIDINLIRENPEEVKAKLAKKLYIILYIIQEQILQNPDGQLKHIIIYQNVMNFGIKEY